MTDTDIWNWISAFIQSFAETFLLVNVYCAFLGQPRIKKYVAYSLISCFAIAYCVFINVFTLPTYLRYSLSLCVFFAYSMAWNGPGWKRLFAVCTDVTINALASSIVYWLIDFMRTDRGTCLTIDSVLFATPNVLILVTISMIFSLFLFFRVGKSESVPVTMADLNLISRSCFSCNDISIFNSCLGYRKSHPFNR